MKNLLSENMLRFGTKNLSEAAQRELTLKSIMETINEHGLHNEIRSRLTEAPSTYEGSMESLYQGVVNALNKSLKAYQTANPAVIKFQNTVFAWNKKGLGKPADPNMVGITDAKYYIIYGPKGSTSEEKESVTYISTLMPSNGAQTIGRQLTNYLNTIPTQIQAAPAKSVVNNWVKTYTVPKPAAKD